MFLADESLNDLNAMDQFFDSEEVFVRDGTISGTVISAKSSSFS